MRQYSSRKKSAVRPELLPRPASKIARTSPPAQKARPPAPRMRTAWICGSAPQARRSGSSVRYMPSVSVLSAFGRLSVTRARPPRRSSRISSVTGLSSGISCPGSGAEQAARDDEAHDLVGPFEDLVNAQIAQVALDRVILDVAVTAM